MTEEMEPVIERVRGICMGLPEVVELTSGRPAFAVRKKTFVMYMDDHHGDGRLALWCKAAPGAQEVLVQADRERFFVPPYVGPQGWVGVRLDRPPVDWGMVESLIVEAWTIQAPKRLAAAFAAERGDI
jgi:hypothetical protein